MDYQEKFEIRKKELRTQLAQIRASIQEHESELERLNVRLAQFRNQEMVLMGGISTLDECLGWGRGSNLAEVKPLDELSDEEKESAKV